MNIPQLDFAKDWRIGLYVKPKMRSDVRFGQRGRVVDVFSVGTAQINDPDGVVAVRMDNGETVLSGAGRWCTSE